MTSRPASNRNPAADSPRVKLIRASAGSGKTFQLSSEYLRLLRMSPVDRILAVTFTRKAAGEILERILLRLAKATVDEHERQLLADYVGGQLLARDECLNLLATVTRQLHRLRIGTLDSLFSRLATSFSLELGLPQSWTMADEDEADQLRLRAVDAVLRETSFDAALRLVHLLGKEEIQRSVTNLILQNVKTLDGVFRRSPAEAWQRIVPGTMLPDDERERLIAEIAAFDLSKSGQMQKGRDGDIDRLRSADWQAFLAKGLAAKVSTGECQYYNKPIPDGLIAPLGLLIGHARAYLLTVWANQTRGAREILDLVHRARRGLVEDEGLLGFDDVADALSDGLSGVDGPALAHRLDCEIGHLLLDEFQDTSLQQWNVLRPLARDVAERPDGSIFSVGDVKQSIYGWRGGEPAVFDLLSADFPGLVEEPLDQSRRSSPVVIDAVNQLFQNLPRHGNLEKDEDFAAEWSRRFPPHTTAKKDAAGYVCLETSPLADDDNQAIAALAADRVAQYVEDSPWATVGVLTRTNDAIPRLMYALSQRGIVASEEGGISLQNSAGARVIFSALTLADHPGDSVARYHVVSSRLGSLLELKPNAPARHVAAIADNIREQLIERGYEAVIAQWTAALRPDCDAREWIRLRQLVMLAAEYESRATLRPCDFVRWVERKRVEDSSQSNVRVMTVHKAKGLEFDVVILPELDWAWFKAPGCISRSPAPGQPCDAVLLYRSQDFADLLPEDLRTAYDEDRRRQLEGGLCCLYVAATRAVHVLHMIVPPAPDAAKFPKTAAGLVRAALTSSPAAPAATTLFSLGDPQWHSRERYRKAKTASQASPRPMVLPPIKLASAEPGRTRGRATVAPSRGKEGLRIPTTSVLTVERERSTSRGTLWHAWCQLVEWLDDGLPDEALLRKVAVRLERTEGDLSSEMAEFFAAIGRPAMSDLLSRQRYQGAAEVKCFRERAFTVIDDGQHLSGTMDRLVLLMESGRCTAAEIVDFKTDAAGEKSGLRDAYIDQLRLYARAVERAYGVAPGRIAATLAWLATGVVEKVDSSINASAGRTRPSPPAPLPH